MIRQRLPNRRASISFELEVAGLRYAATVSRFADGRIGEVFLNNHKSNSAADVAARDSAIVFSIAVQHGADPEVIRRALCRNANGQASEPLGAALDAIAKQEPKR
jgi:ribonucleoside-diphosphate reductase alpha chain